MSEFNVVLEGEYKGKKIKKGSFLEIITRGGKFENKHQ